MKQIEQGLYSLHKNPQAHQSAAAGSAAATSSRSAAPSAPLVSSAEAFGYVAELQPDSPAAAAGLQVGDRIVSIGSVSLQRHGTVAEAFKALPGAVMGSENSPLPFRTLREGASLTLDLVPKKWSGQGLLGCLIKPVTPSS
jgi:26S proteasome non-ATPase regulatory subunit 9